MWIPLGGGAVPNVVDVARQINTVMAIRNYRLSDGSGLTRDFIFLFRDR